VRWLIEKPHAPDDWYWIVPRSVDSYHLRSDILAWCNREFGEERDERRWVSLGSELAFKEHSDLMHFLLRWG
jgi:hypothetical protein